jgi:hypothetical protein
VVQLEYVARGLGRINSYPFPVIPDLGKIERFPYQIGLAGGYLFDLATLVSGRQFPISSIRIKKFYAFEVKPEIGKLFLLLVRILRSVSTVLFGTGFERGGNVFQRSRWWNQLI